MGVGEWRGDEGWWRGKGKCRRRRIQKGVTVCRNGRQVEGCIIKKGLNEVVYGTEWSETKVEAIYGRGWAERDVEEPVYGDEVEEMCGGDKLHVVERKE